MRCTNNRPPVCVAIKERFVIVSSFPGTKPHAEAFGAMLIIAIASVPSRTRSLLRTKPMPELRQTGPALDVIRLSPSLRLRGSA